MLIAAPCDMPSRANRSSSELVDHDLEVADHRLERQVRHVPIGQAGASLVVADERPVGGELGQEVPPDRALPSRTRGDSASGRPGRAAGPLPVSANAMPNAVGRGQETDLPGSISHAAQASATGRAMRRRPASTRTWIAYVYRATPTICAGTDWVLARMAASAASEHTDRPSPGHPIIGSAASSHALWRVTDHGDRRSARFVSTPSPGRKRTSPTSSRASCRLIRDEPATTALFGIRFGPVGLRHLQRLPRRGGARRARLPGSRRAPSSPGRRAVRLAAPAVEPVDILAAKLPGVDGGPEMTTMTAPAATRAVIGGPGVSLGGGPARRRQRRRGPRRESRSSRPLWSATLRFGDRGNRAARRSPA